MALSTGARLGPYEIVSLIGAGGMGEVYRARDTRLKRDVAIKILPDMFAKDSDRLARFEREAELLATLNHPNIGGVYGSEQAGDISAIVLELVEGETLADRIRRGPIPVKDALDIAVQIAEALDAAHERGVIHRDLKPANVKITSDGNVKVLDFGLAKAMESRTGAGSLSQSPTLSMMATQAGVILGTAAYMAPEQAKGLPADQRSDIFSFGIVLYEMLTGRPPFQGDTAPDVLASVLVRDPDFNALPPNLNPRLIELLKRCLEKPPKKRWRAIGDVHAELQAIAVSPQAVHFPDKVASPRAVWARVMAVAAFALVVGLLSGFAAWRYTGSLRVDAPVIRFAMRAPDGFSLSASSYPALSPNGTRVAFAVAGTDGHTSLWVRSLDALAATPIPGTDEGTLPFWSPDGNMLGFFAGGKLKKLTLGGGVPEIIADAPSPRGATWGDDVIVFGGESKGPLFKVPSRGGTPQPVTTLKENGREDLHSWPSFLPDGRYFIYYAHRNPAPSAVWIQSLDGREAHKLSLSDGTRGEIRSGMLIYVRAGALVAQPFDDRTLDVVGDPIPVGDRVGHLPGAGAQLGAASLFSVSRSGVMAYFRPQADAVKIVWVDRRGEVQRTFEQRDDQYTYASPAISPDGSRVAMVSGGDVWVTDLARGVRTRLSSDGASVDPVWAPDGRRIVYASHPKGVDEFVDKTLDGSSERHFTPDGRGPGGLARPYDWSSDGQTLAYLIRPAGSGNAVTFMSLGGGRPKPTISLVADFDQRSLRFSPDGHWIAYVSAETGRSEVYIQKFPNGGSKSQASVTGGDYPRWRQDGRELFWIAPDGKLMAAPIRMPSGNVEIGNAMPLFASRLASAGRGPYDVAPDGQHFVIQQTDSRPYDEMAVAVNWPRAIGK